MDTKMQAPNPEDTARVLQEVAERSAKIFGEFAKKDHGASLAAAAGDELGIAKAYMDLYSRMLGNPVALAAFSSNMMADYMQLWQSSWMKMMGVQAPAVAVPAKGDSRFKDDDWSSNFLFDYMKQSYLIASRHIQHAVANVEGLPPESVSPFNPGAFACRPKACSAATAPPASASAKQVTGEPNLLH